MKKLAKLAMMIIIIGVVGFLFYLNNKNEYKTEVVNYDNFYNENNIKIFYEDESEDSRLEKLREIYKVNDFIKDEKSEMDIALRLVDVVNSIVEYDEVKDSGENNAFDILKDMKERTKVSGKDMAIIYRDLLYSVGIKARVGEFRNERTLLSRDEKYFVVEYWSEEYSKWIMVDFIEKGYIVKDNSPLSAIEIVDERKSTIEFLGKIDTKIYKERNLEKFQTYTINIDNTLDMKKSNSALTFVESEKGIYLEHCNKFIQPTIFTETTDIFLNSPEYEITKKDTKPYIILMKKSGENNKFTVAAFKDGNIIEDYYIKINKDDFKKQDKYFEVELDTSVTSIEISTDGKESCSKLEVKLNY